MAAERNEATFSFQSRVRLAVECFRGGGLFNVRIDNSFAVKDDLDVRSLADDLLAIPFTYRLKKAAFGCNDSVD